MPPNTNTTDVPNNTTTTTTSVSYDNISGSFDNMFVPYSNVWEVSGTAAPMWTWKYIPDENGNMYAGDVVFTTDDAGNDGEVKNKSIYDIRTIGVIAPFSMFSRWQMVNYTGIMGTFRANDPDVIDRYFDTSLARENRMWKTGPVTYANIIDAYKNIDAARYKIEDFIYNKYYGFIPPNYLITLRRYAMPCGDIPFNLAYDEKLHKEVNTKNVMLPISTATTYMSEMAGNKMDDILKFAWGTNWNEATSEIQTLTSGTPGASSFGFGNKLISTVNNNNAHPLARGFAMSAFNGLAGTHLTPAQQQVAAQYAQVDPWQKYSKYTQGPVDVIKKTKIRDTGLNFEQTFNLKFEYELKSLQYVNPKIAMLDIIGNMITMGTNTGSFWGGATRYYGNGGGFGKQPGDLDAFARGDYATYGKSLVKHATNFIKAQNNGAWPSSLKEWLELAKNIFNGAIQNMIGSLINGNLGQLGFTQPANAILSDEPTGYWHVTIGNPLNPIAMMGNMICKQVEMQMGEGLGYDDFPVNVTFTCSIEHGKPRDAGDIESMFNAGKGRIFHTPFLADLNDSNLSEEDKKNMEIILTQIGDKSKDPMHISSKAVDNYGKAKNSHKRFSSTYEATNDVEHVLYTHIDKAIALIR